MELLGLIGGRPLRGVVGASLVDILRDFESVRLELRGVAVVSFSVSFPLLDFVVLPVELFCAAGLPDLRLSFSRLRRMRCKVSWCPLTPTLPRCKIMGTS